MIRCQRRLVNTIDNMKYYPQSMILLGESGGLYDEVCDYIATKFNSAMFDISEFISQEFLDEIQKAATVSSLYVINISKVDFRKQNILLKSFEEPSNLNHFILICEAEDLLLDTLKNRGYLLKMDPYTKEDLEPLIKKDHDLTLKICSTPGQVELANLTDLNRLYSLCQTILKSVSTANYQNTLSISSSLNFKDEYSKYDPQLFFKTLKIAMLDCDIENRNKVLELINKTQKMISSMNDKKQYFEHFLTNLWLVVRKS